MLTLLNRDQPRQTSRSDGISAVQTLLGREFNSPLAHNSPRSVTWGFVLWWRVRARLMCRNVLSPVHERPTAHSWRNASSVEHQRGRPRRRKGDDGRMSRRRTARQIEVRDTSAEAALEKALDDLFFILGFCLPPDEKAKLRTDPPSGVDEFTDAVIRAEGMDPVYIDSDLRRRLREIVAAGSGASSDTLVSSLLNALCGCLAPTTASSWRCSSAGSC